MLNGKRFILILPYGPGGGFDSYARLFTTQSEAFTGSSMLIRYMPGAGTMIGVNALVEAGPSDLVLGLFNPNVLLNDMILGRDSQELSSLIFLASLYTENIAWVTRRDNPMLLESSETRLFAMASNTDFARILLPGYALGWNTNLVRGYSGSSEALLAVLRGDVDYFYLGAASLSNQIKSMGGLKTFVSLSEGPSPFLPEALYLAGAGGLVEQLSSELNVEQQRERQEIARLTVELAKIHRAISISSGADSKLVDCLSTIVETVTFSDEMRAAAGALNLVIEPKNGAEFQAEMDRIEAMIESNWELLQELANRSR